MKKTIAAFAFIAFTAGFINAAHAQSSGVGVAGDIGTTGVGMHTTIPLREDLNARLGAGYLSYSYSGKTSGMHYSLKQNGSTYDALLDWYPNKDSSFHLTTGLMYNGNKMDVSARPNSAGSYTVGGNTYDAASAGSVRGKVNFNKIAPYLGVGWGRPAKNDKGWSFSTDVGLMFQGSPKTSLSSAGCSASTAVCNQLASDVARENRSLRDEASRLKIYPVLRVGISYKF